MSNKEITWSLFHPIELNVDYMEKIIAFAKNNPVDSFEICGACHISHLSGLDGLAFYAPERNIHSEKIIQDMQNNISKLNKIIDLAHGINKKVYYWHREVTIPEKIVQDTPAILDKNKEFNLLGEEYKNFLEEKITNAFKSVPNLDGIVLTLTEADFSTIHNSTPEIYPPADVVKRISSIFANMCKKYNKKFILRSFGSIAKDYEDILAGAKLLAKELSFEVETKITPYDFDPFLPENPFLFPLENLTTSAECDSLGEFLGAGYLPAENVDNIVKYVRFAEKQQVNRFAIRLDRVGNSIFDTYPINLFAYTQAILNPEATAQSIKNDYAKKYYPEKVADELIKLGDQGFEMIKHINFINGNIMFHSFPLLVALKWIKAGGIFSCFKNNISLEQLSGIWAILSHQNSIGRENIIAEKELALKMANDGIAKLKSLKSDLPSDFYNIKLKLWENAKVAATAYLYFCKCVQAYFDEMEQLIDNPICLKSLIDETKKVLTPFLVDKNATEEKVAFFNGMGSGTVHKHTLNDGTLDKIYVNPIIGLVQLLLDDYYAELNMRKEFEKQDLLDYVIPGSLTDDYRCKRYMHASHARLFEDKLERFVGNQVFPNGYVEYKFKEKGLLKIYGYGSELKITVNSNEAENYAFVDNCISLEIEENSVVKMQKVNEDYPALWAITLSK